MFFPDVYLKDLDIEELRTKVAAERRNAFSLLGSSQHEKVRNLMEKKPHFAVIRIILVLAGCLAFPLLSRPQSLESSNVVSVRKLSIPRKALQEFEQGNELLAKMDPVGSLTHFQRAVAKFGSYYEAYYMMGVADLKLKRAADAEQAFRKSIDLSGGRDVNPLVGLAAVLNYQEKYNEAEEVIRKGLDRDPTLWYCHLHLGWALFGLTRWDEAEKSVREALHLKPDSPEAVWLLAAIHSREKDYRALVEDLDRYLKLDPDSPNAAIAKTARNAANRALLESENITTIAQ